MKEVEDKEAKQDISSDDLVTESTMQVAAGLYLELKKHLKAKDFKRFKKTLDDSMQMSGNIGCGPKTLI